MTILQSCYRRDLNRRFFALLAIAPALYAAAPDYRRLAPGWAAPDSPDYKAGIDPNFAHGGHASLYLKSVTPDTRQYAVRQFVRAERGVEEQRNRKPV